MPKLTTRLDWHMTYFSNRIGSKNKTSRLLNIIDFQEMLFRTRGCFTTQNIPLPLLRQISQRLWNLRDGELFRITFWSSVRPRSIGQCEKRARTHTPCLLEYYYISQILFRKICQSRSFYVTILCAHHFVYLYIKSPKGCVLSI